MSARSLLPLFSLLVCAPAAMLRAGHVERWYRESHALVIAASDYQHWRDLPGARVDAQEIAAVLEQHGFRVRMLIDPTRRALDDGLRDFSRDFGQTPESRLLIYFAGHGHTLKTGDGRDLGYIVPVDAPRPESGTGAFKRYAMSMGEVETMAHQLESRHVLFVFDSCFSGSVFHLMRGAAPPVIGEKLARPVREFISAGAADQPVPDNGLFRQQFVKALQGAADGDGDGYITGVELGSFLEARVTNYSKGTQTPQFGKIRDPILDQGDIVFAIPSVAGDAVLPAVVIDVQRVLGESIQGKQAYERLKRKQEELVEAARRHPEPSRIAGEYDALISKMREDELAALEAGIKPAVDSVGRAVRAAVIFNKFESGILYVAPQLDVTDAVLAAWETPAHARSSIDSLLARRPLRQATRYVDVAAVLLGRPHLGTVDKEGKVQPTAAFNTLIARVAQEQGYTLVMSKFESGLVYLANAYDITAEVTAAALRNR